MANRAPGEPPQVMIHLPHRLRTLAGEEKVVAVRGRTVGEALDDLILRYPDLRPRLREAGGQMRSFLLCFLNAEDIRARQGEATPLAEGDELTLVFVAEGG